MDIEISNSAATKSENGAAERGATPNGLPPSSRDDGTQGNTHIRPHMSGLTGTYGTEKQPPTGEGPTESGRCRALYSFTSEHENELSLKEGHTHTHTLIQTAGDPRCVMLFSFCRRSPGHLHKGRERMVVRWTEWEDGTFPVHICGGAASLRPGPGPGFVTLQSRLRELDEKRGSADSVPGQVWY